MCSHIGAATVPNLQTESWPYDGRTFWKRQIYRVESTTQSVGEVRLHNTIISFDLLVYFNFITLDNSF